MQRRTTTLYRGSDLDMYSDWHKQVLGVRPSHADMDAYRKATDTERLDIQQLVFDSTPPYWE